MGKHRTHSICGLEPSQMNSIRSRMCFVNYSQLHLHFLTYSTNLCHLSSHSYWPARLFATQQKYQAFLYIRNIRNIRPSSSYICKTWTRPTSSHDNLLMKQRFKEGFTIIVQLPCCFTPPLLGKSLWHSQSLVRKIFSHAFPSH